MRSQAGLSSMKTIHHVLPGCQISLLRDELLVQVADVLPLLAGILPELVLINGYRKKSRT